MSAARSSEPAPRLHVMPQASANMLVYREGRRRVPAYELLRQLEHTLASLRTDPTEEALLSALLRAGELECALWDAASAATESAMALSDQLANMASVADMGAEASLQTCQQLLSSIDYDGELTLSRPEGFAYYALHPLDFADVVASAGLHPPCAHVIGIRSIGTTLSAVVAAKLRADGISATRTTVRPTGHPYDRQTTFSNAQRSAIRQALSRGALFVVCDEGPGRSGSSLLSVAEALEQAGVRRGSIVLLCSHQPNVDALCAPQAAERWRRYRSVATGMTKRLPQQAADYIAGGEWRKLFFVREKTWPAAWPHMERLKFLSRDGRSLFEFEGHGPYGKAVRHRAQLLAASEFGAPYLGHEAGFGLQKLIGGKQVSVATPSASLLKHAARYCAWRAHALPAAVPDDGIRQLEHMAAHNLEQEFRFAPELHLEVECPALCDGRMQHYEWRELGNNRWVKLDASTHGDDHFFPGPTDIAWDLAGFCVEWQLDADDREFFLSEYRRFSGDNPTLRLQAYEIAYAAFRLGWSRMAAASLSGSAEEGRLLHDAACYRAMLDHLLAADSLVR